ncbi:alpha/beta hydrolase [Dactylosporangium sp. NPDC049525]|uniref:alpha/beta hydrolase n=1 Tax=Dactylosporangium sp. NPDC049525 TaxID=3154730 RepID=UPI0034184211
MRHLSETTADGVSTRHFTLGDVPGVLWTPAGAPATGGAALILLAHGGRQDKTAPTARAHRYVRDLGVAVAAIDAPGHGDRPRIAPPWHGRPTGEQVIEFNARLAAQAVPEWRAVIDELRPGGPVGFGGASLGTGIGIPLVAAEPRIAAAVLGLAAGPVDVAARITVPVQFLLQWHDELVPRDAALALFDAFGSADKTLHANPGGHGDVPAFELDSSARSYARHLLA